MIPFSCPEPILSDWDEVGPGETFDLRRVLSSHAVQLHLDNASPDSGDQIQSVIEGSLDGESWYPISAAFNVGAGFTGTTAGTQTALVFITNKPARFLRVRVAALVGDLFLSAIAASSE